MCFVGNFDLAAHGVDGDQRPRKLPVLGQIIEQLGDSRNLVGLFRHAGLRQHQARRGGVGAERMQGLGSLPAVVGAPGRFAINSDELRPIRPRRRHPALEAALEQNRINSIEQNAQPALAGNAVFEGRKAAQHIKMRFAPGHDVVEVVARADRTANDQEQHFAHRKKHPPRLSLVRNLGKMLQQQRQTVPRHVFVKSQIGYGKHGKLPGESDRPENHISSVNPNSRR